MVPDDMTLGDTWKFYKVEVLTQASHRRKCVKRLFESTSDSCTSDAIEEEEGSGAASSSSSAEFHKSGRFTPLSRGTGENTQDSTLLKAITLLKEINKKIDIIQEKQVIQEELLKSTQSNVAKPARSLPLPAQTMEELEVFMDADIQESFLYCHGATRQETVRHGATLQETVRRIMRTILTKSLALTFSLTGLGAKRTPTKRSFSEHRISKIVIDAALKMHKESTRQEVVVAIQKTLKAAPDWDRGSVQRKRKSAI